MVMSAFANQYKNFCMVEIKTSKYWKEEKKTKQKHKQKAKAKIER